MPTIAKKWRHRLKRLLIKIPQIERYVAEKHLVAADRDRILKDLEHQHATSEALAAERDDALSRLQQSQDTSAVLTGERDLVLSQLKQFQNTVTALTAERDALREKVDQLQNPVKRLVHEISSGEDLVSDKIRVLSGTVEQVMAEAETDTIGMHREIGKALFARSVQLYSGEGLPEYLVRYTYPEFLSIALSSHCNAACFFCRESDFKGSTVEFDNLIKLESAIRKARTIDLTGWGEPFFYPRFEDVLDYIGSINNAAHLIQITTNG